MGERAKRKVREGVVASNAMDKTVVVVWERKFPHPLYRKVVKRSKRLIAHDEDNSCRVGDLVRVMETRPLSKTKRWRVVEILRRGREG